MNWKLGFTFLNAVSISSDEKSAPSIPFISETNQV